MKTKVVPSTLLSQFRKESFYGKERELRESAPDLAAQLGVKSLKLYEFNETTALFEADNGHFLRAGYEIDHGDGKITFDQFADVVVDDVALIRENHKDLSSVIACLLEDDQDTADALFDQYLDRKLNIHESSEEHLIPTPEPVEDTQIDESEIKRSTLRQAVQEALGTAALFDTESTVGAVSKKLQIENSMGGVVANADKAPGNGDVSQITLSLVDTKKLSQIVYDRGEKLVETIVEGRKATKLLNNEKFVESVLKVKSLNATGEVEEIGEAMSELVTSESNLLYFSIEEVAEAVRSIFEGANTKNWDEQLCLDIAEGAQKLSAKVYEKMAGKVQEAAEILYGDLNDLPEDTWEAYKVVSGKLFETIKEGENKLHVATIDLQKLIENISPILKDEGYRRNDPEIGSIGRTLERYGKELVEADLNKVEEVVHFIEDYITKEALQLGEDGEVPAEAQPKAKGDQEKDPNGIPYRSYGNVGKLGPYGEEPKLMAESVGEAADELGIDFDNVVDWLSAYKEANEEASLEEALEALKEAWQLGDDGEVPAEARPKKSGGDDKDPEGISYRTFGKGKLGYKKDADSKEVDNLNPDEYEEIKDLADLIVPAKGKTADPRIAKEAWQLEEDGETPKEAEPKAEGDEEKDPNGLPYRTYKNTGKLGPYGEKSKLMDEQE